MKKLELNKIIHQKTTKNIRFAELDIYSKFNEMQAKGTSPMMSQNISFSNNNSFDSLRKTNGKMQKLF